MNECVCHQWYDTEEIGDWLQHFGVCASFPVRRLAAGGIWDRGHFEPQWGREKLTALIGEAAGIAHEYALLATTCLNGAIMLDNGVHRWSIADELGIKRLPVNMRYEPQPQDPATKWAFF